jgi:hypothetical protein
MDRPISKKVAMRMSVALMEETVRLIGEVVGELGRYIAEWKRLPDPASPLVPPTAGKLRRDTEKN